MPGDCFDMDGNKEMPLCKVPDSLEVGKPRTRDPVTGVWERCDPKRKPRACTDGLDAGVDREAVKATSGTQPECKDLAGNDQTPFCVLDGKKLHYPRDPKTGKWTEGTPADVCKTLKSDASSAELGMCGDGLKVGVSREGKPAPPECKDIDGKDQFP